MGLKIHPKAREGVIVRTPSLVQRILRRIRRVTIGMMVLVVLLVGAAATYAWYTGKYGPKPQVVPEPVVNKAPGLLRATEPGENTKVGVAVQLLASPVEPGKNTSISIRTKPFAECVIKVEYNKVASIDSGLIPKKADEFGIVNWAWTVEPSVPVGLHPIEITCVEEKQSAFLRVDIQVAKPE